jgi:hypothetical protein
MILPQAESYQNLGGSVIPGQERKLAIRDQIGGAATEIEPGAVPNGNAPSVPRGFASRVLSAVEARQGVVSGRVVTVLGVSLSLALLGIVLAFVVAT